MPLAIMVHEHLKFPKPASMKPRRLQTRRFEWTRSLVLALSLHNCANCHGSGLRIARGSKRLDPERRFELQPCRCVLREIFRIVHQNFVRCVTQEPHLSRMRYDTTGHGKTRTRTWGRPDEEFIADFCSLAKLALQGAEYDVFRFYFLLDAGWKACARKMGVERGAFFHALYRVEERLGRFFTEVRPYGLFPVDEYYASTVGRATESCLKDPPAQKKTERSMTASA